jgi:EF-P beta-lysylation protein EpmB
MTTSTQLVAPNVDGVESRWQQSLRRAFRSRVELAKFLELDCRERVSSERDFGFKTFVTREFAARMRKGDWDDPLLRQVWPDEAESRTVKGFAHDAVGDNEARIEAGLLQKYHGRVLMIATGACAVHCRYCFRRHYPYSDEPKSLDQWLPAIERIRGDQSIQEVILSGGDPLTLSDDRLSKLVGLIESIPHVERLRIHTRLPIVLPSRITLQFRDTIGRSKKAVWMVVHCNHPNEIDDEVGDAFRQIREAGGTLLNQAVLLRGVNDDATTMESLCRELIRHSVIPYYLHALDRVQGAAHFEVERSKGLEIIQRLRQVLPGYAVPQFVEELAAEPSKTPIGPSPPAPLP